MLTQPHSLVNQASYFIASMTFMVCACFSRNLGKMLGYTVDDLTGRSVFALMHYQDKKNVQKAFSNLRKGRHKQQLERRL
jgi:PAS domain S-box-containing protein